jgi:hypothetical protein
MGELKLDKNKNKKKDNKIMLLKLVKEKMFAGVHRNSITVIVTFAVK